MLSKDSLPQFSASSTKEKLVRKLINRMLIYSRRAFFWLLVFLFLIPSPVWAAECVPEGEVTDLVGVITCMLGRLADFLIRLSPLVAVALLAYGGVKYMASTGEERALQSAKQLITWTILGFILVAGTVTVFKLVFEFLGGSGFPP